MDNGGDLKDYTSSSSLANNVEIYNFKNEFEGKIDRLTFVQSSTTLESKRQIITGHLFLYGRDIIPSSKKKSPNLNRNKQNPNQIGHTSICTHA